MNRGIPAGNPVANILVIIVGALAIGASVVLGFFAFIVVGSIVLIMASIIGLRVWWFNRKLQARGGTKQNAENTASGGVIEGEYQVIADDPEDE